MFVKFHEHYYNEQAFNIAFIKSPIAIINHPIDGKKGTKLISFKDGEPIEVAYIPDKSAIMVRRELEEAWEILCDPEFEEPGIMGEKENE